MSKIRWENVVFDTLGWTWGVREFIEEIRRWLPDAERREGEALNKIAAEFEWDIDSYAEKSSEIQSKFEYWMPRVAAYSLVTMLHVVVETQLLALAKRLRQLHEKSLKPKEISGGAVEKSKIYLTKVIGLPIGEDPAWQELQNLADIRHIVVHARGAIGDDQKRRERVEVLKQRYPDGLSEQLGELRISLQLCEHFVEIVEQFFRRLFQASGLPQKVVVEHE